MTRSRRLTLLILVLAAPTFASAQIIHASGPLPTFEVATVRPWHPPPSPPIPPGAAVETTVRKVSSGGGPSQISDRVHFIGQAVLLIAQAYNISIGSERSYILGAPEWATAEAERYEVQAKIDDAHFAAMQKLPATEQREQVALMEQALLAERFHLKLHFETREMPVYSLVIAKGGPHLTPAKPGENTSITAISKATEVNLTATAANLTMLIRSPLLLSGPEIAGHPIGDETGLTNAYDFTLRWTSNLSSDQTSDAPSLFTAVQEQLGLRLVSAKGPVEVLVIDHIERPTEN